MSHQIDYDNLGAEPYAELMKVVNNDLSERTLSQQMGYLIQLTDNELYRLHLEVKEKGFTGSAWDRLERLIRKNRKDPNVDLIPTTPDGMQKFWEYHKSGDSRKLVFIEMAFISFLEGQGFCQTKVNKTSFMRLRITNNIVTETSKTEMVHAVKSYLESYDQTAPIKTLLKSLSRLFSDSFLMAIKIQELKLWKDGPESCAFPFRNGVVMLEKDKTEQLIKYDKFGFQFWQDQIIDRNYDTDYQGGDSEFDQFLSNAVVPEQADQRWNPLCYLMHTHKSLANARTVVCVDAENESGCDGRTGKGIYLKFSGHYRQYKKIEGESFDPSRAFKFQSIELGDQIMHLEDVKPGFNLRSLFNPITSSLTVEGKGSDRPEISIPFSDAGKFAIDTNFVLAGDGKSYDDRVYLVAFSKHYQKIKPVEEFGHILGEGWSDDQWQIEDHTVIAQMQKYLDTGCQFSLPYPEKYQERKIYESIPDEICEYCEGLAHGQKYDTREEWVRFQLDYENFIRRGGKKIQQRWFSDHIKKWAEANGLTYELYRKRAKHIKISQFAIVLMDNSDLFNMPQVAEIDDSCLP